MTPERRAEVNRKIAGWLYPGHHVGTQPGSLAAFVWRGWVVDDVSNDLIATVDYTDPAVMVQILERFEYAVIVAYGIPRCWLGPSPGLAQYSEGETLTTAVALAAEQVIDVEVQSKSREK